jgi:hypothetical protein
VVGGEADPTRWAVGDDVDGVKTVAAAERGGNLLRALDLLGLTPTA